MFGLMQDAPMLLSSILKHAQRYHGTTEVVSRLADGSVHRSNYSQIHARSGQLANALLGLGIRLGDRVATLAWNGYRHMETYYAVSGIGAICHTINPRLFLDQIAYIVNDAQDAIVLYDDSFIELVAKLRPLCPTVRHWILMAEADDPRAAGSLCYEALLAEQPVEHEWASFDERTAAGLCYTSGTTGNPKGVLYSHRSTMLMVYAMPMPDAFNLSARDVLMAACPMFHVNAWGFPFAAPMVGAKLVLPGPDLAGPSMLTLFEQEGVTIAGCVPTVWHGFVKALEEVDHAGVACPSLKRASIGGAACPISLIETLENRGIEVLHSWGMTETSPLGAMNQYKARHATWSREDRLQLKTRQGRPPYGIDMRIVDAEGRELPWDGVTTGELHVRGPWVLSEYFNAGKSALTADGWLDTGDVASIDADGYMQITDRSKDIIKSGGEWISSLELENIAMSCPGVSEAAAIAVAHPKWQERPLLLVVRRPGEEVDADSILKFFSGKIASWQIPDAVEFVESLPRTATGKLSKADLRQQYRSYTLPVPA